MDLRNRLFTNKVLKFFLAAMFFSAVFLLIPQTLAAPSTVGTSTSFEATSSSFQRKSFYAEGLYWAFYSDGANMVYKTSSDGATWSSATVVRPASSGETFSVFLEDSSFIASPAFHYAFASGNISGNIIYYRKGWPNSDGTVAWAAVEQELILGNPGDVVSYPVIATDYVGYPWIGFSFYDIANGWRLPRVIKSSSNSGAWSTPAGFPYQLSAVSDPAWRVMPVPLTGGKMYVLYNDVYDNSFKGRLWDGFSWGAQEVISYTSPPLSFVYFSAVNDNDDVYLVYYVYSASQIIYARRTYGVGWVGLSVIYDQYIPPSPDPLNGSAPVLSVNQANGDLYAFWAGSPEMGHIYYKKYTGGVWDANPTDWLTDAFWTGGNNRLTGFYQAYGNNIGLMYVTGTSPPSNVRFNVLALPLPPTVATNPATLIEETTATLNGEVANTGGENPTRYFDWDIDSGVPYANQINVGVGGVGLYSSNLTGLNKGALYYFRARAVNSLGTGTGNELTLLTKPDEPTNFTAIAGNTRIALSWTKGAGANQTMVRRSATGYPAAISQGTQVYFDTGTTYTDIGLTNGTTYYYSAWSEIAASGLTQYSDAKANASVAPLVVPASTVSGWAWSENIGWLSFSSWNCDADDNGFSDGSPAGCPPTGTTMTNYGVNINQAAGNFIGSAWSENIGWIDFAPAGPYPALPNYPACLDFPGNGQACDGIGNYNIGGWVRALSYGNGWDGWIKLRGTDYGVSLSGTGDFSGYAWSDLVMGWIKFAGVGYKVRTSLIFNSPPDKPSTIETDWSRCSFLGSAVPTFTWTYSDPDGDPQAAYEIEVDDNSSFSTPKFNHLVNLPSTSYVLDLSQDDDPPDPGGDWISQLAWNTTYFWKVRVKDSLGNWSAWSNSSQSKTDKHASPWVDFTWTPPEPTQRETVEFIDQTEIFGGVSIVSWLWAITQGTGVFVDGTTLATSSPHIQFSTFDNTVRLEVTDSDGYSCYNDKDVTVQLPLPEYKEVPPLLRLQEFFLAILTRFLTHFSKFAILF